MRHWVLPIFGEENKVEEGNLIHTRGEGRERITTHHFFVGTVEDAPVAVPGALLADKRLRRFCRPFGVPDIFLADKSAASSIDPGTHLCSASSATGSAEQRGRGYSLRSLYLPPAALPSLPLPVYQ